ncbi:MAG TPA: M66 family metalloprotease, partial [Polyangiaceae bacterium]
PAPPPQTYLGAVGTWCGPADDQTVWLYAAVAQPTCDTSAGQIYSDSMSATPPPDGVLVELPSASLSSFPATITAPLRHCELGVCSDLQATITLDSYQPGVGAQGAWTATGTGGETMTGLISASWCAWDELLPAHPQGERLARDISLAEVAFYQSVKVPVVSAGQAVAERNADVIAGKGAAVRVFVEPQAAWQPREVAVRLTLSDGVEPQLFELQKTVTAASSDEDLDSTFNFEIPGEALTEQTTYQVEIRETSACTALDGAPMNARFPAEASMSLGVRASHPVKVTLVPVAYDADGSGRLPDTSEEQEEDFRSEMLAVYPAIELALSVREPISTDESSLSAMLNQIRALREDDEAAVDQHYYGLVSPAETFRDYCNGSCTTGIASFGSSRNGASASSGMGMGFLGSSAGTFVHELGHMHNLPHAPCGGAGDPDPEFPYEGGGIGVWGYDLRSNQFLDPSEEYSDFMGYCRQNWISDYNYQLLFERIVDVAMEGAQAQRVVGPPQKWLTLLLDATGAPSWGLPINFRGTPDGAVETAEIYDRNLGLLTTVDVYRVEVSDIGGAQVAVPEPGAGWAALRVAGAPLFSFAEKQAVQPYRR